MIFWVLLVLALLTTAYFTFFLVDEMQPSFIGGVLGLIFGFPLIGVLVGMFAFGFMAISFIPAERHPDASRDTVEILRAIQMVESTNGQFFLGSGVINEENTFTYYAQNSDGSYNSGRLYADAATVIESDTEKPRIITHHWYWSRWIMPHFANDGFDLGGESYTIYVPTGSVKPLVGMDLPR